MWFAPAASAAPSCTICAASRAKPHGSGNASNTVPSSRYERAARKAGYRVIAGLDEAGRGALFGPVFAGAVVLDPENPIRGLDDSKALEPDRREVLAGRIRQRAVAWAVGAADPFEIDRFN